MRYFLFAALFLGMLACNSNQVEIEVTDDEIQCFVGDQQLLSYRCTELLPPGDVDPIYKRSAYIHPLRSPGGEILTRIQPPDHYHHYGIWSPWTKTHIKGREIDYWNLAKAEGTVRFRELLEREMGNTEGRFSVMQDHIDFGSALPERITMEEKFEVRVSNFEEHRYTLDLSSTFTNVLDDTILLDAYRYGGGLGYRATERWKADNCKVLTSEGEERSTADGTKARWCIVEGESDMHGGRSGILFLSHPDNREHPEPMRVWPPGVNQGEMFFEFCPIRHNEWVILPGESVKLLYRMIVFDGAVSVEEAENYWNEFANK